MNAEPFFRITRGQPDAAELAALTAVLTALVTAPRATPVFPRPAPAPWRRPERTRGPRGARSWRDA
ncbi:acyl-CoA carboxylase subunit epsilon [Actinophytocola sp.]|uniref:acyl-CoA carboxylase subunit epsilon n=1 Tax=Actinophytocola sp. TaxID=1872138 RepID=UPI00389AC5E9